MAPAYSTMTATDILELYFIENRARLLDIASFLDRIDRYPGAEAARRDFRYRALMEVIGLLASEADSRTVAIQHALSDPTTEPLPSAAGLKAHGAWDGVAP